MSKAKIKVFGASGCGNVGDDLIALILGEFIKNYFKDKVEVNFIPQQKQDEEIKDADVLIIGGGGLIYDYDINNVKNYCNAIEYAHSYRIPTYFMGMGVQHVFTDEAKAIYRHTLPKVSAISTRGTYDTQFITEDLQYNSERVITSRDLVFLYDDLIEKPIKPNKANTKPVLALSLADWKLGESYHNIKEGLREEYEKYRQYLEVKIPTLKDKYEVKVVCQANEDKEISEYLASILGTNTIYFPTIEDSKQLVEIYKSVDYVVTNRYHGLIAAIIARTPALSVSYSTHKSQRLVDDSFPSLRSQFYTIGDFVKEDVLTKIQQDDYRKLLRTATEFEYRVCIQETKKHKEILKYIAADIAKHYKRLS